jgi:hypothetical protein
MVYAALLFLFFATVAIAQPEEGQRDMKARVLDILFPLEVTQEPCFEKLAMRFGDSDTQLVVLIYPSYPVRPGGNTEIIRYSLAGMDDGGLSELINKMVAQNPNVTDREIAAKLKVKIKRSPMKEDVRDRFLKELAAIRIPPVLQAWVALDDYPEYKYEFWFDNGQGSIHYMIAGPNKDVPENQLVQWMIRFREKTLPIW